MTGKIVSGQEAASLGLVTAVCEDPMDRAVKLAESLLQRSPDAVACTKELYHRTWETSEKECLEVETELQEKLLVSFNQFAASGRAFGLEVPYLKRR